MRRTLLAALLLAPAAAGATGVLGTYSSALFSSQQGKDGYTVIQFHSEDCSVCPRQETMLDRLARDPAWQNVLFLQARYEKEEELRRTYGVDALSTLLFFRGKRLIGRSAGLYTDEELRSFFLRSQRQDRGRPKSRPERRFLPRR
ncbi:MAG: thioredoxin family protein [Elusimicrobiota bacterium]|jgi:hypothetical protein